MHGKWLLSTILLDTQIASYWWAILKVYGAEKDVPAASAACFTPYEDKLTSELGWSPTYRWQASGLPKLIIWNLQENGAVDIKW